MLRKYPGIFLLLVIIPGILLGDFLQVAGWIYLLPATIICGVGLLWLGREHYRKAGISFGLGLLLFAAFHFSLIYVPDSPNHIVHYTDSTNRYHLFGTVVDWPELRTNRTELKVALDSIGLDYNWQVKGVVLVRIPDTTTAFQRNDRLEFYGRIYPVRASTVPGGFDYQRFMRLKGVFGVVYLTTLLDVRIDSRNRYSVIAVIDQLRQAISNSLKRNLSPEASALAAGFLIGETRNIPTHIYKKFRDTGTLHLLAVSGSNVALVLGFVLFLIRLAGISRPIQTGILLLVLVVFTLLSYGEPSVIRASVMAGLVILATLVQRKYDLNNIIALTAAIILLVDPTQLYDVGFQLSFVTAWGLIFFTPKVYHRLERFHHRRWARYLLFPIIVSLIAQVCSAPLIALYFHSVPVISPLANLVIVPLVSFAVIGILCVLVADLLLPILGLFIGSLVNVLLIVIVKALDIFGKEYIPVLHIGNMSFWIVILLYGWLILGVWACSSKYIRRVLVIGSIVLINLVLLWHVWGTFHNRNYYDVWFSYVSGGVVTIIKHQQAGQGDMIVTNIRGKEYSLDEYILIPLLRQLHIEKLHTVLLLSADYNAIDDLLIVARSMSASQVVISEGLANSVHDVIRFSLGGQYPIAITTSNRTPAPCNQVGYYPFEDGVNVNLGKEKLTVISRLTPELLEKHCVEQSSLLVVGSVINVDKVNLDLFLKRRFSKVICAKIAHSQSKKHSPVQAVSDTLAEYVTPLSRTGSFHLQIPVF